MLVWFGLDYVLFPHDHIDAQLIWSQSITLMILGVVQD